MRIAGFASWEDDIVQLAFPGLAGGANKCSLIQGQIGYAEYGACERRNVSHVRKAGLGDDRDSSWRPLDVVRDRYLHFDSRPDFDLWQTVKNRSLCLDY